MASAHDEGKPAKYDPDTCGITAFLIDLDGTMYRPGALIDGAQEFHGAKGSPGVQKKFLSEKYKLCDYPVPLRHIWTASEAQMDLLMHTKEQTPHSARFSAVNLGLPYNSKVFVMAGGEGFWLNSLRMKDSLRFDSWDIRTSLSEREAKEWAKEAHDSQAKGKNSVFVVLFLDGKLDTFQANEQMEGKGRATDYNADWSFALLRKVSFLLHHGAQLVYTADDAFNPSVDEDFPGMVFPLPGPGMFAAMMKFLMAPADEGQSVCAGKGGSHGDVFMMEHAIAMLKAQGHNGDKDTIMMI
eukprot:gene17233-27244_t